MMRRGWIAGLVLLAVVIGGAWWGYREVRALYCGHVSPCLEPSASPIPVRIQLREREFLIPRHYIAKIYRHETEGHVTSVLLYTQLPGLRPIVGRDEYRSSFDERRQLTIFLTTEPLGTTERDLAHYLSNERPYRYQLGYDAALDMEYAKPPATEEILSIFYFHREDGAFRDALECGYVNQAIGDDYPPNPHCQRDENFGGGLGLRWRFNARHLPNWPQLRQAVHALISEFLNQSLDTPALSRVWPNA